MVQLCEEKKCTGCMACVNSCSRNAISSIKDAEGFLRPIIDAEKCIECGKCVKSCPQLTKCERPSYERQVYACWIKNPLVRKQSTSGGAFSVFANSVFKDKGIVIGVGFDENLQVIHKAVSDKEHLGELRGSKYVQSDIGLIFREVKKYLSEGKKVLFSGTACQIAGLYSYLNNRYVGQLWTIDLVCHGVPSPEIYRSYLQYIENKYKSKAVKIFFRNKKPGWYIFGMRIEFSDGQVYERDTFHDPYIRGFLRNLFLRPSCHCCDYSDVNRVADITLADFWGYQETCFKDRDNDLGISMVMINTSNGNDMLLKAKNMMSIWKRTVQEAVDGNRALNEAFPPSDKRIQFWKDYKLISFPELVDKYMYSEEIPEWAEKRMHNLKLMRKKRLKSKLKKHARIVLGEKIYNYLRKCGLRENN